MEKTWEAFPSFKIHENQLRGFGDVGAEDHLPPLLWLVTYIQQLVQAVIHTAAAAAENTYTRTLVSSQLLMTSA